MKNKERLAGRLIASMYVLGLLGMFCVVIGIHFTRQSDTVQDGISNYINISSDWTLDREGTMQADLGRLGEYMDEDTGILSIYHRLSDMKGDESLVYRSKDVYTKLLVDDTVVYETNVYDSKFYNRSPGNLWNVAKFHADSSGRLVEMQIYMVYDTRAVTVDSTLWGDKTDIILTFCKNKLFGIAVSLMMMIIGLVLIAFDLMPAYIHARKHHGMVWLGLYSALIGVWSLIETNAVQFFVDDMRILQLIDNMIMILDSMPLLLYLNCEYQIFKFRFMRLFCYADVAYILVSATMQISGVNDLHGLLPGAMLTMVVSCVTLLVWVVFRLKNMVKGHQPILNYVLQLSGLCSLWISALCEMMRYSQSDHMDRAEYLRSGCWCLSYVLPSAASLKHTGCLRTD